MRRTRKPLPAALGLAVRWYRRERGVSQEELAFAADLHPTYVSRIERGRPNITIETLEKLGRGLEMPASALLAAAEALGAD
jgi:transcriptional regulator with XRE-family HTH domain